MKKIRISLALALVLSSTLVAGFGAYIKFEVLQPLGIMRQESIIEIPFLLLTDDALQFTLDFSLRESEADSMESDISVPDVIPSKWEGLVVPELPVFPPEHELPPLPDPNMKHIDESWFDDALFIGDSRTVGMRDFGRIGKADYFCTVGMTVYSVRSQQAQDWYFGWTNLSGLLSRKQYGKIIISLGLNECGYPHETTITCYQHVIDSIKAQQPDAEILLQGIMAVGKFKEKQGWVFSRENLGKLNKEIESLARRNNIYYFDVNRWAADDEGYLPAEFSADGCHPLGEGYIQLSKWIMKAIDRLDIPR